MIDHQRGDVSGGSRDAGQSLVLHLGKGAHVACVSVKRTTSRHSLAPLTVRRLGARRVDCRRTETLSAILRAVRHLFRAIGTHASEVA